MKRILLPAILILFILSSTTFAQLPIKLGGRVGLNIANLSFDPDVTATIPGASTSGRAVFLFGGVFQLGFAGPIALEVEPTYIQKGGKAEANNISINGIPVSSLKLTYKLSYLEIPILLRVNLPVPGIKPYAEAGPTIGFNMSSTVTTDFTANGQSGTNDTDDKDNTSSTEFGLAFGAGVEYGVAPFTSLVFDVRYALGLSNTQSNSTGNQSIKTNGIQLSVGVLFGL